MSIRAAAEIRLDRKVLSCHTLNVSSGGAKLELSRSTILPSEFEVAIPSRKIRRRARLVWRCDDTVGVQFCGAA